MQRCKLCKQGIMEELIPIEDMSDTMTKEKVDQCSCCGAICKTIYKIKDGSKCEKWMSENKE